MGSQSAPEPLSLQQCGLGQFYAMWLCLFSRSKICQVMLRVTAEETKNKQVPVNPTTKLHNDES